MTNREIVETVLKLEKIADTVRQIREKIDSQDPSKKTIGDISLCLGLEHLEECSAKLQRYLCPPRVLDGYKRDAMDQAYRVVEMIEEIGDDPDNKQIESIGYSCDLVTEKVEKFKQMCGVIARIEVLTGDAIGGHA